MSDYTFKQLRPTFELVCEGSPVATVERIGRGQFCTAYRDVLNLDTVYLRVKDTDHSKEILSQCDGPYIPQLARVGMVGDDYLWKTKFYQRLTAKRREAWRLYRLLKDARWSPEVSQLANRPNYARDSWGYDAMHLIADKVAAESQLSEVLHGIADASSCYGQTYMFEFAPRNLATDADGHLILLDPIFNLEVVREQMEAKRKHFSMRGF